MIHIIDGDLFKNLKQHSILIHQTNCLGIANAGIAKQIKNMFPGWFKHYSEYCKLNSSDYILGTFHIYNVPDSDIKICSVFGQNGIGKEQRQTDYEAWKKVLPEIVSSLENRYYMNDIWTVRMPYGIGCGLGGGDWNIMKDLFEYYAGSSPVDFIFYRI